MSRTVIPLNDYDYTFQFPLLKTKLQMPRALSGLVDRPRVYTRLDGMLQGRLTLVTAPAGFGKTCAMAQWARQKGLPVAWLSLDGGDNDAVRFWTYVAAALGGLHEAVGVAMTSMLRSSTSPPWEAAISLLIDDLSQLTSDVTLVLDDYHVISEPIVHETMSFLLRYAPDQFHPVIAGRTQPPLSLPRLRAAGLVTELTARDLGFSVDEVAAFYTLKNIDLTGEEVERLVDRTGGWAAGMQMAAMSVAESGDKALTIERFGGRDRLLAGYFMEEVFGRFGPAVQEFLLQTSILGHLSGPLCEAVTGRPDSGEVLASLGRTCGFVAGLDDRWYVCHHLFAEFLQGLLKERHPEQIRSLYGKAACWCEAGGLLAEAVDYFLQGEEYDQAASLVERLVPEMLDRGETATLFRWLEALPPETVGESTALCVAQAWAAVAADRMDELERWLERGDAAWRKAEDSAPAMGGENKMDVERAILRAYLSGKRRNYPETLRWLVEVGQRQEKVLTYGRGRFFPALEISLLGGPMGCFGRLQDKAQTMESGVYLKLRSLTQVDARAGYLLVANAEALYEWNKIDAAVKFLVEGIDEAQRVEEAEALVPAFSTLAKIHRAGGNLAAALATAEEAERKIRDLGRMPWLFPLTAMKTRLHLVAGDTKAVGTWMGQSRLDIYDRLSAARSYEHITLARVLLARGRADRALLLLRRLLVFAEKEHRLHDLIEIANLLAIACDAVGRTVEALEILRGNLSRGRVNGYLRIFVDEGMPMLSLLRRLARNRPVSEEAYLGQLLDLLKKSPVLRYPGLPAAPRRQHSFTARELAVLRLAATGLDNRAIARELSVGLETVKTHLANIYGKLGADGRRDAVKRAQELGVLQ